MSIAYPIENPMVRPCPEPEAVAICEYCGCELFEGDAAYRYDGGLFCDPSCVLDYAEAERIEL